MTNNCCHLTCTHPAVWSIRYSDKPDDYSEYCNDHLLNYLPVDGEATISKLLNVENMEVTLSEEVQKAIEEDAEIHASVQWGDKAKYAEHHLSERWDNSKDDYEAGAIKWAKKCQGLIDALTQISNAIAPYNKLEMESWITTARQVADESLNNYSKTDNDGK